MEIVQPAQGLWMGTLGGSRDCCSSAAWSQAGVQSEFPGMAITQPVESSLRAEHRNELQDLSPALMGLP